MLEITITMGILGLFLIYRVTQISLARTQMERAKQDADVEAAKDERAHRHYLESQEPSPELLAAKIADAEARKAEAQVKSKKADVELEEVRYRDRMMRRR